MDLTPPQSASVLEPAAAETIAAAAKRESPEHSAPPADCLPENPLVEVGGNGKSRIGMNVRNVWAHRELLYFLTWRDVKVRYKQTFMGAAWAIIQPFLTMLVFAFFFGTLVRVPSDGIPYPIFAYTGLLPWTFFSNAVTNSSNSLIASSQLITKVYFPRIIIPAATIGAGLLDLAIAALILVGLAIYYGIAVTWNILLMPLFVVLATLLAFGIGTWVSALNVKYRDVRHALPFTLQFWMFASPIIYPSSLVPERWRWILALNPLTGIIEGFRSSLVGRPFDWQIIAISAALTFTLLACSIYVFRRIEKSFADFI